MRCVEAGTSDGGREEGKKNGLQGRRQNDEVCGTSEAREEEEKRRERRERTGPYE